MQEEHKIVQLVDKFNQLKRHCDELSRRIEEKLAWKHDLDLQSKDIQAVEKEVIRVEKEVLREVEAVLKKVTDVEKQSTWLIRLMFGVMLSGVASLIFFILGQVK
jgi:seryl-tRNA synthetase